MSVLAVAHDVDPLLAGDLLAHLDAQLASARRLLSTVLAQGLAIRARDVDAVVRHVAAFQSELERRARLEAERECLLLRAGAACGLSATAVTLTHLTARMSAPDAELAQARSAELQGVLAELAREHGANQALMRQELAFLDHLLRLVDPAAPAAVYARPDRPVRPQLAAAPPSGRALDLHA
jgi:hypothetical protein